MPNLKFLFLISVLLFSSSFAQYCEVVTPHLNNKWLYTAVGESAQYFLDDWIVGYNLKFEFGETLKGIDQIEINQPAEFQNSMSYDEVESVVGQSYILLSNGSGYFSRLGKVFQDGQYFYNLFFGEGSEEETPPTPMEEQIPYNESIECYDIAQLTTDIVMVDCTLEKKGDSRNPLQNFFYISNRNDIGNYTTQYAATYFAFGKILGRKTLAYTNPQGDLYAVSGILFDDLELNRSANDTYLNFYRYISDKSQEFPQGRFTWGAPVDSETLGLDSMMMADFNVLGDRIWVLDHTQGIITFRYSGDEVVDKVIIPPNKINNLKNAYGLSVTFDGGWIEILIADGQWVYAFRLANVYDDPQLFNQYQLPFELVATPNIQSNQDYIAVQVGEIVLIFDKDITNPKFMHTSFESVQLFTLFPDNFIFNYYSDKVQAYVLQEPSITITPGEDTEPPMNLTITARSRNFADEVTCSISFHNAYVPSNTQSIYSTGLKYQSAFFFENATVKDVLLDLLWVGPNVQYEKMITEEEERKVDDNGFQGHKMLKKHLQESQMYIDQPEQITIFYNPQPQIQNWLVNELIDVGEDIVYSIHQENSTEQRNLVIYRCSTNISDIYDMYCQLIKTIEVGSPIIGWSTGTWGGFPHSFAFVTIEDMNTVQFFTVVGQQISLQNLGLGMEISDIEIDNNMLYVVNANNDGVFVFSDEDGEFRSLHTIDAATTADWPIDGTWSPNYIMTNALYPNILFIQTDSEIMVINIDAKPIWIANLPIKDIVPLRTKGFLGKKCIVVATSDDEVYSYSLQNLKNINQLQSFQTYGYNFAAGFSAVMSQSTGFFYVLATNENQTNTLYLMIYKTHKPLVQTLYKVLVVDTFTAGIPKMIDLAVSGTQDTIDYVYVNTAGRNYMFRVPVDPIALINPTADFPVNAYTHSQKFVVQLISMDRKKREQISQRVTFVNNQTKIIENTEIINDAFPPERKLFFDEGTETAEWPLNVVGWFNGPVLQMNIDCQNCGEGNIINIKNRVNKWPQIPDSIMERDYIEGSFFSTSTQQIFLMDNQQLYIYDTNWNQSYNIPFEIPGGDSTICWDLLPGYFYEDELVLQYACALCQQQDKWLIQVIEVLDLDMIPVQKRLFLPKLQQYGGQAQIENGKLLILNKGNPGELNTILVYNFFEDLEDPTKDDATLIKEINTNDLYLGEPLNISAFRLTRTDQFTVNKLFVANMSTYIYACDVDSSTFDVLAYEFTNDFAIDFIDILQEVDNQGLFYLPETQIIDMAFYDFYDGEEFLEYQFVIVTNNTAMYQFTCLFNDTEQPVEDQKKVRPLIFCDVTGVYGNYGTNIINKRVAVYKEFFAVSYWNYERQQSSVCVYSNKWYYPARDYQLIQMLGGYQWDEVEATFQVSPAFLVYEDDAGNPKLFTPDPNFAQHPVIFDLDPVNVTITASSKDFPDQQLTFYIISDYNQGVANISSTISHNTGPTPPDPGPKPEPEPEDKGSSYTWIIIVAVIVGILILGGVGFYFYKRRQETKKDSKSEGFSMQEPLKA